MVRFIVWFFIIATSFGFSLTPSEERQLLKDIAEIKATLKTFMNQTNKRFEELRQDMNERFRQIDKRLDEFREDMNERFRQIDKRFEQVDKRFEQTNRELDRLVNIMVGIFAGQIALVVAVIGFAWWDRRTIIRKAREETIDYLEREGKLKKITEVLREMAKTNRELEELLRKHGLL